MIFGPNYGLHNKAHPDTITSNHKGKSSTIRFESITIGHVQHSDCFLFKSIVKDMEIEPKGDLPIEAHSLMMMPNHKCKFSPIEFETNTIDQVHHSGCFLSKSIEQDMKVGTKEDKPKEAHPDTITPNHNSMSSPVESESKPIYHVQHSGYCLFKRNEPDMKIEPKEDFPNEKRSDTIMQNHSGVSSPFIFQEKS